MSHTQDAARAAAEAVETVLDQLPQPGAEANQADVLAAQAALHAAERAGAGPDDIRQYMRNR
ncbi:hypothetical protein EYS09_24840 [Streptomyces kasugaensis]|uniref:Uncharacterized protein n=1 Tax=Streptomyces kasugaensis TaxID=1946 RepID=A0A4V2JI37_STRKA|nr:hypothetical protein [Streptomyces kasugaensis]TBO57031.1 hypothetical protein EYS09_24840 [Streptomyces kasugaensis]